jgi:FkbM family methyltransferase
VFDIGANVGEWAVVLRSLGCRVVAVEPQNAVASQLMARFARDSGAVVVPMAVAAAEGELDLHYAGTSPAHASASTHWMRATRTLPRDNWSIGVETVRATTIDNLIHVHGHPRFCKIDVEGFELEALQGLSEPVPILQFEFHYEILDQLEACLDRVCSLGSYRFNVSIGGGPELNLSEWAGPETLFSIVKHLYPTAWGDVVARAVSD